MSRQIQQLINCELEEMEGGMAGEYARGLTLFYRSSVV